MAAFPPKVYSSPKKRFRYLSVLNVFIQIPEKMTRIGIMIHCTSKILFPTLGVIPLGVAQTRSPYMGIQKHIGKTKSSDLSRS